MSYNGSGVFVINSTGQPVVTGTVISSSVFNSLTSDLATGLSTAITKDGQTTITNNIPFGNNKITGLAVATTSGDALSYGQAATVAALTATSISDSGNLTFTGTGNRITGDFSNATQVNRVAFQTSTANSASAITVIPNGTSTQSSINIFNNSTPTNASLLNILINATVANLNSTITGTGTYLPMTFSTGGSEQVRIDTSGNVGIGTTSPTTYDGKTVIVKTSSAAETVPLSLVNADNATNTAVSLGFSPNFNIDLARITAIRTSVGGATDLAFKTYSGSVLTERMRIDSSGNVGIGTSSPNKKLEVLSAGEIIRATSSTGANDQNISIKNNSGTADTSTNIFFADRYAATSYASSYIRGTTSGTSALIFATGGTNFTNIYDAGAPTERMRIDSSGNVLIGTNTINTISPRLTLLGQTAGKQWSCGPTSGNDNFFVYNQASAGVYISYGGTSWTSSSDERIKDIIEPITDAANKVSKLRAVIGKFKADEEGTRRSFLIAQDVQAVLPEAVNVQNDEIGTLGVAYTDVIPLLVAAIQELNEKVAALEARLN